MSSVIQPRLLRRLNLRRVLELLKTFGPSTRADLTRLSGISAPTVSKAVANLIQSGLLEEGDPSTTSLGRPGTVLRLARDKAQVLGVVLDARRCTVVSAGLDGTLNDDFAVFFDTPDNYAELIDLVATAAMRLKRRPGVRTLALGMSIPGLINRRLQQAVLSPNLHITDGHSPDRELSRRLGIECVMYQETQALCLGHQLYGAGDDAADDFAMLEISTGLGLGVVSAGRLMEGHSGLAGELGHITVVPGGRLCGCGNRGCLETVATDSALARNVSERIGRTVDIEEAARLIREGVIGDEELHSVCEYLSIAIAAAINIFNPATLFIHGRLFDAQEGLFEHVSRLARSRALSPSAEDCNLFRARWSKDQAAVAAAILQVMNSLGPVVDE